MKLTEYEERLLSMASKRVAPSRFAGKNAIAVTRGMQRLAQKGMLVQIYAGFVISDEGQAYLNAKEKGVNNA